MSPADDVTRSARVACANWLRACLRLGWPRERFDDLEALWWRYHDRHGALIDAAPTGTPRTCPFLVELDATDGACPAWWRGHDHGHKAGKGTK